MIVLIGLGIDENISVSARKELESGKRVLVQSELPAAFAAVRALCPKAEPLDYIYEKSRTFDSLHKNLAAAVDTAAKEGDVIYCVYGGITENISAQILLKKHKDARVIDGVSKSEYAFCAAKVFATGRTAVSAYEIEDYRRPALPLAVYDLDSDLIAGDVKLRLGSLLGDEVPCFFVSKSGVKKIKLYEADRQKEYDCFTALVVDRIPLLKKERFDYVDLCDILKRLRAPDGCPWDRAQTHESIRKNMVEEAYELVDAIDSKDDLKITEEAGDVLMQAAFHATLAEERGAFDSSDVLSGVCSKLIFRHSHVFGGESAAGADDALSVWEKNKRIEKNQKTAGDSVADVPKCFPALLRAQKVGKRAAKSGYDFKDVHEAAGKVEEELKEALAAIKEGNPARVSEEVGDLLFSAVNVGRLAGADCEESLQESTAKFIKRFLKTEELVLADGKNMRALPAEKLWEYYERAKELCDD